MSEEKNKSVSFDVTMDSKILYDYMINHAYTGSSGILGTCFGVLGILFFLKTNCEQTRFFCINPLAFGKNSLVTQ